MNHPAKHSTKLVRAVGVRTNLVLCFAGFSTLVRGAQEPDGSFAGAPGYSAAGNLSGAVIASGSDGRSDAASPTSSWTCGPEPVGGIAWIWICSTG